MLKKTFVNYMYDSIVNNWDLEVFDDYEFNNTIKYKDLASKIVDIHQFYKENGIKKGSKISLVGRNSSSWATIHMATTLYGAVIVPILPDFSYEAIANIINDSDSELLFLDETIYQEISKYKLYNVKMIFSLSSLKNINGSKDIIYSNNKIEKGNFKIDNIANDEIATMIYTSGTTGFSKGVILSHNCLAANVEFAYKKIPLEAGYRQLSFLPLAHVFGCLFDFLFPFSRGVHITFLSSLPTPAILVKALGEVRPHLILAVPLILEKVYYKQIKPLLDKPSMKILLKIPLLSVFLKDKINRKITSSFGGRFTQFIVGGSALNQNVEQFFKDIGFRLTVGYGMTECAPLISYTPSQEHIFRSCGRIINFLEIKIDSKDPYNEVGEIMVRGENVFLGYYKNEDATKEVFTEDGWFKTGDLGVIDNTDTIFIRGRSKNMLLGTSGENIYPEEIESIYNSDVYIMESLVVQRENNRLVALIYPDFEKAKADGIEESKLKDVLDETRIAINKKLPVYSHVHECEMVKEEFEKNPTKKITRFLYK